MLLRSENRMEVPIFDSVPTPVRSSRTTPVARVSLHGLLGLIHCTMLYEIDSRRDSLLALRR